MGNKQLFFAVGSLVFLMFLYLERGVLAPFILAAVFAYIFNPLVSFLAKRLRFPKFISIILIYLVLLALLSSLAVVVGGRLISEAKEITQSGSIDQTAQQAIDSLPDFNISGQEIGLKSSATNILDYLHQAALNYQSHTIPVVSGALRQAINVLVFFLAGFYILRDWPRMRDYILGLFPKSQSDHVKTIWGKVSVVLGNYLRGQLILITLMAIVSFIALEVLGVRYALILAILTGILEIIPYVGPIVAAALAAGSAFLNGQNRFALDPATLALIVIGIYFVLRHLEDYFVIPIVYNRLTKLHPLVVIFSVLAGGHLFGVLGLVLAVPVAASLKVILEYLISLETA
jgi:predicted PurR-regulated permease PerM